MTPDRDATTASVLSTADLVDVEVAGEGGRPTDAGLVGTMLEHYELIGLLGQGGMGTVYLAQDTRLDRKVAVKVLKNDACGPDARARLLREAQNQARAAHPNVVTIYECREIDGRIAIVMELVPGRSAAELLQARGRLSPDECVRLFAPVLDALTHLHAHGIVHRDLKPGNIMVVDPSTGAAKVMDFGLARSLLRDKRMTEPGMAGGTLAYVAPEVLLEKEVDRRSDIYSAGVTLYELLVGHPPFRGTRYEVAAAHLRSTPVAPSAMGAESSARLDEVVLRALAKEPTERFASADDLKRALIDAVNPPPRSITTRRRAWTRPLVLAAGAVAAAGVAIAGVATLALGRTQTMSPPPRSVALTPPKLPSYRDDVLRSNPLEPIGGTGSVTIQRRLVSSAEYARFVASVGDAARALRAPTSTSGDAPASWIAAEQARGFCQELGARLPTSSEWALAVERGRALAGPIAEWTSTEYAGLVLVREPSDRGLEPSDPFYKATMASAGPHAGADVVASERIGFRCAR